MKFFYIRSTCSLAVLNKGLKLVLHLLKQLCVYSYELHFICAEYVFETFDATNDICVMAFHLNPKCIDVSLETIFSTSDEIYIITNDLQLNCYEDELKTRHTATEGSSILTLVTNKEWKYVHCK